MSLYTGDRYLAQELAQEALARLCRDWKKVRRMDNQDAWIYRVAINLANSSFRRRAIERRVREQMGSIEPRSIDPPSADGLALREALSLLPRRQRTALILRYYADMPFTNIAAAMDAPEPTVKSWTRRGLERLRKDPALLDAEGVLNA